jgi:hypothetical protein
MIDDFIDSAIIIDDKPEEIVELQKLLESKDIWTKHFTLADLGEQKLKNRKIIFLDLYLDESKTDIDNISTLIRPTLTKYIGKNYGAYGIILWTKHDDKIDEFKKRIINDSNKYTLPLFIIGLDKTKYIRLGHYNTLFEDINTKLIENTAANFFILWDTLVKNGKDNALINVYSLLKDYINQDNNLQYILFQLARNYTGIPLDLLNNYPLFVDAFKSFNDMMTYELVSSEPNYQNIFNNDLKEILYVGENTNYKKRVNSDILYNETVINNNDTKHVKQIESLNKEIGTILSVLNRKLLLDEINIKQDLLFPGNIYEIIDSESKFKHKELPASAKPIIIDLTSPCDFSNMKMESPRILGGFIIKYSKTKLFDYKKECFYKEIWPLNITGNDEPQMIIFDFKYLGSAIENDLKDIKKYNLLFRAKDKLLADILQKSSSYLARLGLAVIH